MTGWETIAGQWARQAYDLSLDSRVIAYLDDLPAAQPILVACSGGADSVFLVLALRSRLKESLHRLQLLHFNHGLRGAAADADANFVEDMARDLGLRCAIGSPDGPLATDEASLRRARYDWFCHQYHQLKAGGLCLGHHAGDVLESQIMALFAGSGPAGLAAPSAINRFADGHVRLRPMLALERTEIESRLRVLNVPWREDASNQDTAYTRNWIRHEWLPLAERQLSRNIHAGSRRTHLLMQEAIEAIDAQVASLGISLENSLKLSAERLAGQPRAVIRRTVLGWWLRHRESVLIEKEALDRVIQLIQENRSMQPVSIGQHQVLELDSAGYLNLQAESNPEPQPWLAGLDWSWATGPAFLPGGASLTGERVDWNPEKPAPYLGTDPSREAWLAGDHSVLRIRQWRPGDRYRPLRAPGTRKLQDLFGDAKLNGEQKHRLPVLSSEKSILWVPGFPPNNAERLLPSGKSALKLTYIP